MKKALLDNEDRMILMLNTCFILTNNKESVINQASGVCRTLYNLNQPSTEAVEIKDDDSSDNDEDESNNIPVTQSELLEVMKEGEEEDKEEEALEVMEMDDMVRIASEAIASLSHSPPNTVTLVESASTGEIASSTPSTSQLQVSTLEVSNTSSIELIVTSLATKLAPAYSISTSVC